MTGKEIQAPHFFTAGMLGKQYRDWGNMDASPVMQRFREKVMQHTYYSSRATGPAAGRETGLTRKDSDFDQSGYDGGIIAFRDLSTYATFFKIECAYDLSAWRIYKDAVDLGRF